MAITRPKLEFLRLEAINTTGRLNKTIWNVQGTKLVINYCEQKEYLTEKNCHKKKTYKLV